MHLLLCYKEQRKDVKRPEDKVKLTKQNEMLFFSFYCYYHFSILGLKLPSDSINEFMQKYTLDSYEVPFFIESFEKIVSRSLSEAYTFLIYR